MAEEAKEGAGMRLINADEIQYTKDWVVTDKIPKVGGYNAKAIYRVTKEEIDAMPTVDAVPVVHGRWQWISSTYDRVPCEKRYWCSKCHHETITHDSEPWEKFCPNCGARMNGKDGDS